PPIRAELERGLLLRRDDADDRRHVQQYADDHLSPGVLQQLRLRPVGVRRGANLARRDHAGDRCDGQHNDQRTGRRAAGRHVHHRHGDRSVWKHLGVLELYRAVRNPWAVAHSVADTDTDVDGDRDGDDGDAGEYTHDHDDADRVTDADDD